MKFSANFERDYEWYLTHSHIFIFDGTIDTDRKVIPDMEKGLTAKECFYLFDSRGKIKPTKEPEILYAVHKCKGSINFNIKMWAEQRGKGWLGKNEFIEEIVPEYELLDWMINAVEEQRMKYWNKNWGI